MIRLFVLFFTLSYTFVSNAQTTAEVKNVDFTVVNDTMFIAYDIDKIRDQERFIVSVCIKTTSGKTIYPKALTGDIGDNIKGGKKKKIIWAITKDNAFIDEEGSVEVTAKSMIDAKIEANNKNIGIGKAIVLSTLLPGLGNTKLSGGKPYWLLGIAAYGCLAGGIVMSLNSSSALNDYNAATTESTRDDFMSKSKSAGQTATYLFVGAGVLWVGDIIFTAIQAKKSSKATSMNKRISVGYNYDTAMKQPLMMIRYKF